MKAQLVFVCLVALLAVGVSALSNPTSASAKLESLSQRILTEVSATDACGGLGGSCKDISTCSSSVASVVRGKCPGSASNICCVPHGASAPAAPVTSYGKCTSAGKAGNCQKSATCNGATVRGLCPGDSSITCCIGGSAASSSSSSSSSASSGKDSRLPVPLGGVCTQNGQSGKCQTVSTCTGGIVRGLCAGNGSISCCMTKDAAAKAGLPKVKPSAVVRKPYVNPRTAAARRAEAEMRTRFSRFKARNRRSYKTAAAEVAAYNQFKANRERLIALNDKHRKTDNVKPLFMSTSPFSDISPELFRRYFLSARLASTEYAFLEVEEQMALEQMDPKAPFDFSAPAGEGEEISEEEIEEFQSFVEVEESQGPVAPTSAVNDGTVTVGGEMIVDWRPKSSPVKMQAQCGSCWAHAVVSVLESAQAIAASSTPMVLSPQQIIDCNTDNGQGGCNGGAPTVAFDWLKEHGSTTAASYPYKAATGPCQIENGTGPKVASWASGTVDKDETKLLNNLKKYGPMALYVDASNWATYNSGIYPKAACNNTMSSMDHAVVLTGYGVENGVNFWLVRNSWDTNWGEQGYIRLEAGANSCGLALYPSYVQV